MSRIGVVAAITVGVIVSGGLLLAAMRARRQRDRERDVPELNKHPERLEQMLDPSDDA